MPTVSAAKPLTARPTTRKSLLQHVSAAALMSPAMAASIAAGGVMVYSRPGFGQSVVSIDTARTVTVDLAGEFSGVASQATVNVNAGINVGAGFGINANGMAPNNPQTWDIINNGQTINGATDGVYFNLGTAPGSVTNAGVIRGQSSVGVVMRSSGTVVNQTGAMILGASFGVRINGDGAMVTNDGTITGNTNGIFVAGYDATISNNAGATVTGTSSYGIYVFRANATVTNAGTVTGGNIGIYTFGRGGGGARITNSGTVIGGGAGTGNSALVISGNDAMVTNLAGGRVLAVGDHGVRVDGAQAAVVNAGMVYGGGNGGGDAIYIAGADATVTNQAGGALFGPNGAGVNLANGGVIDNQVGAAITGGLDGILVFAGATTITNAGLIGGGSGFRAIQLAAGDDVLNLLPGSTLQGGADGGGGFDQINLFQDGFESGDLSAWETLDKSGPGTWELSGNVEASATTRVREGELRINGTLTSGDVSVDPGARLGGAGSLSGEIHGSLQTIGLQQERDFHDLLRNRNVGLVAEFGNLATFDRPDPIAATDDSGVLATLGAAAGQSSGARNGHGRGAWATVYGGRGQLSDDGNASTTDHALAAGAVGFDAVAGEHLFVGGAVGYGKLNVENQLGDDADASSIRLGGYGHYHLGKVTMRATASIARAEVETSRLVAAGAGAAGRAEAEYNRLTFLARGEVARAYKVGAATVEPYVGLEGGATRHGDFTESGVANLDVEADTLGSIQSVIGGRMTATLRDEAMVIVPHLNGEWRHEFADTFGTVEANFVGVPASRFTTKGVEPGRDTVSVGGGVELGENNWRVFLDYQADLRADAHNQTLRAGAKLLF